MGMSFTDDDLPPIPPLDEKRAAPAKTKWRPTSGDVVTVAALVVAVIMWFDPPNWQIALPLVVFTLGVVIVTAFRHPSHPLVRGTIGTAVVIVLALVAWHPIWASFHKDYPRAAFNWPVTLNPPVLSSTPPADPPDMPPTNLPGPTLSKWGKSMFLCQFPADIVPQDPDAVVAGIKRNFEIVGNATGLSLVINRITYGFRIDATANGPEGEIRMGGVQRFTFQIERATEGIFITISFDIGVLGIVTAMMPVDSKSQKMLAGVVTQFTGLPEDKCRML
jgi:hypothetical protein